MRYRRFRCEALIFCPLTCLPVDLIEMTARWCRPAAIARIEDG